MASARAGVVVAVAAAVVVAVAMPLPAAPALEAPLARPAAPAGAGDGHDHATHDHSGEGHSGHEDSEGLKLVAAAASDPPATGRCEPDAPRRRYQVVAMAVDITLNRYLDHDPRGRMYALEGDAPEIRAEERRNADARANQGDPAVSLGLQGDAIEPLTLRVLPGECLQLSLRNELPDEPVSIHLHGAGLTVLHTRKPAVPATPEATAPPGASVTYEWMVPSDQPEGTHYFHSHARERVQTAHGLFGAVIVEPAGSRWRDPRTGEERAAGWDAIVTDASGRSFREFALYYHEVGDEAYQPQAKDGQFVPLVDPLTSAYRPGGRAINYRSEPFFNRLSLQQRAGQRVDDSLSYSSYSFGDPATPILRAYLGDPVKQRVLHAGSEVFHVHHVHGGATRWRRQPGTAPTEFDKGLDKRPSLRPTASARTDSQSIGPSETFDVLAECGSGGCQQSVGDFMFHCHVTHHYFAGMWGIWRVYNTLQDGRASTDSLPPLMALPERRSAVQPAVPSDALLGRTLESSGVRLTIEATALQGWVERQLPPRGVPKGYDASVFDWLREDSVYLGEPETEAAWPAYRARAPGRRPALLFDPLTGKLAYPFLQPHLGKRPPFAPNHGPAPFLDPSTSGTDPPPPGQNGPASVCPAGTRVQALAVNVVNLAVPINRRANLVDGQGQLFVLRSQQSEVEQDPARRVPLVVRANAGEHCVDVLLRSEAGDSADQPFSKVSAHIHFVQFDVQASDGVNLGFNYEQTVRPFRTEGETVTEAAAAGASSVRLASTTRFSVGSVVGVGMDRDRELDIRRIRAIEGDVVTFDVPLNHAHQPGEVVSTEFVRYRWYPDVESGTAFFHDHVNVIFSSRHGLFGALIVEPAGATYHDPFTGAPLVSGQIADIHTDQPVSTDVRGSFREVAMLIQDDSPVSQVGRSTGSAIGMRAEPLEERGRDPARLFSSAGAGDPETPLLHAYVGDPVVIRTLAAANNDVHSWHLDGHWFRREPWSDTSPPTATIGIGISERFDLTVPKAGGPQGMPGDYLYYNGRAFKLREGSWGILRVLGEGGGGGLRKLPGHEDVPAAPSEVCPADAPERQFEITAVSVPLPMLNGGRGKIWVLTGHRDDVVAGRRPPEPLVLHVGVGDCVVVAIRNETEGPVSFHADLLAYDPSSSGGIAAGREPLQTVAPGTSRTQVYYASPEVGETVAMARDWGDVTKNPGLGLYGAIVVGPANATYRGSGWNVEVHPPLGPPYRDVTLFFQDEDEALGTHRMPYDTAVRGVVGLNYTAAPLDRRLRTIPDVAKVYLASAHGDPPTPLLEAYPREPLRLHVLAPWSEQAQVFSIDGHEWAEEPERPGSNRHSSAAVGAMEAVTFVLEGGAGGRQGLPGDYLYGAHRGPYREAGMWGILRVLQPGGPNPNRVQPLGGRRPPAHRQGDTTLGLVAGGLAFIGGAGWLAFRRRRHLG